MDYRMEVEASSLTEKVDDRTPEENEESKND